MTLVAVLSDWNRWSRWLAWSSGAGLLLAALGPFGSYGGGDPAVTLGYWLVLAWAGVFLTAPAVVAALLLSKHNRWPRWAIVVPALFPVCAVLAMLAAGLARAAWPARAMTITPVEWLAQTAALVAPVTLLLLWREARAKEPVAPLGPPQSCQTATATAERPADCLQMEDHYVRIHRGPSSALELMTLRQAIATYGDEGLQVHRSWWVRRAAIEKVEQDARGVRLHLSGGIIAPVSRSRVAALRTAGWLGN